jgi:hypothetical protein
MDVVKVFSRSVLRSTFSSPPFSPSHLLYVCVQVRLQLQNQLHAVARDAQPYKGLTHAAVKISREEGVRGLWKGYVRFPNNSNPSHHRNSLRGCLCATCSITPSMLREASYSSMRIVRLRPSPAALCLLLRTLKLFALLCGAGFV